MSETPVRRGKRNADAIDQKVGARIRFLRLRAGMSQGTLAEAIGVAYQQIQKYESGQNRCTPGMLQGIAKALTCDLHDLLPPRDGSDSESEAIEELADAQTMRMVRALRRIKDARLRSRIAAVIESLAESLAPPALHNARSPLMPKPPKAEFMPAITA